MYPVDMLVKVKFIKGGEVFLSDTRDTDPMALLLLYSPSAVTTFFYDFKYILNKYLFK